VPDHKITMELIARAQEGDEHAKTQLIVENSPLIKSIVRRYKNKGVEYDDLYQLGCLGLVKAILHFDHKYGVQFSTYAVPMIAGEIKRFLRDDGMIKVSRSVKELAVRVVGAQEKLRRSLGTEPGVQQIAKELEIDPEDVAAALDAIRPHISLNEKRFEDEDGERQDFVADEHADIRVVDRLLLKELLAKLDARERQIIVLRYFKDRTQTQVAEVLGVSQVQVSRLESRIIKKLHDMAT